MAVTKYGKYILRLAKKNAPGPNPTSVLPVVLDGSKDWGGIQHRMKWYFVSNPVLMVDAPHSHDFDEILGFYGIDSAHERDFGAEIELSLGREGEKQIINSPTVVCIPRGLIHGPLKFSTVTSTILFCHIYTSPEYVRIPVS